MYRLTSPLAINVGRKKFILNLNQYRNTHYRTLNSAKIIYKRLMREQIECLPKLQPPIQMTYTVYKGDKRNCDIGNICSVHEKFFEDALVELGKLPDDNHNMITKVTYEWGGIDKLSPSVMVMIEEGGK